MSDVLIEFLMKDPTNCPAPYPAAKAIPEWLKRIPVEVATPSNPKQPTVKQCMPFLDAMTSGYIIPMTADVHFSMEAGGLQVKTALISPQFKFHGPEQVQGAPFEGGLLLKFPNPWIVRTPPGYSTLFISPINQVSIPFSFFSGVVDTDTYQWPVAFPALCHMAPKTSFVLARGAPLMQAIPFKRENWISRQGTVDLEDAAKFEEQLTQEDKHFYREELRSKKRYS